MCREKRREDGGAEREAGVGKGLVQGAGLSREGREEGDGGRGRIGKVPVYTGPKHCNASLTLIIGPLQLNISTNKTITVVAMILNVQNCSR